MNSTTDVAETNGDLAVMETDASDPELEQAVDAKPEEENVTVEAVDEPVIVHEQEETNREETSAVGSFGFPFAYRLLTLLLGFGMAFELIGGKYPKFNNRWVSGDRLIELSQGVLDGVTWGSVAWVIRELVVPNALLISIVVLVLQAVVALSLISGLFVRSIALLGLPMFIAMNVGVQTLRTPQWYITGLVAVIILHPYAMFGADRYLIDRLADDPSRRASMTRAVIKLDLQGWFSGRRFVALLAALTAITAVSVMYMASLEHKVLRLTMLETAVFAGLLGAAVVLHHAKVVTPLGLATTLIRIAVGKAALWPILSNTSVKVTSLPGFADSDEMEALLTDTIGESHWGPLAGLATDVLAPNAVAFVAIAGVVQLTVGICMLLGYQMRWVRWLAISYFAVVCLFGFTRTTQYALLFSIVLVVLGSGWELSLDRVIGKPRPQLRVPDPAIAILTLLAVLSIILLLQGTLTADPYSTNVSWAVFITFALITGPLAVIFGSRVVRGTTRQ